MTRVLAAFVFWGGLALNERGLVSLALAQLLYFYALAAIDRRRP